MTFNTRNLALAALAVVQLAVPSAMIARREFVLRQGTVYRFKTAPVDPYDAFRGKYVALQMTPTTAPTTESDTLEHDDRVYVTLGNDADGFATLVGASARPPAEGDYLTCRVARPDGEQGHVRVDLPIDRYYMDETQALDAELAYRRHSRRGQSEAFVLLRVRNGACVIEDLYLAGIPIEEYLADPPVESPVPGGPPPAAPLSMDR